MWAIIEALIFDQTEEILKALVPPERRRVNLKALVYPIEYKPNNWASLLDHCETSINRVQVASGKNNDYVQELRLSPTNKLWKAPNLALYGDIANGAELFDCEAHVRRACISEFPSYLRICLPLPTNAAFADAVRYSTKHLLDAITENNVIGHGFTSPSPDPEITEYDLIGEVMSHSWTEEWRTAWLRPRPLLFGPTRSVEDAANAVACDTFCVGQSGRAIICKTAAEEERVCADLFLDGRLQLEHPPAPSIALGEHLVDGVPLYTSARFQELIDLRLIRPHPPQHVIIPVLDPKFAASAGYSLSSVIALDIHECGAARMFSLLAESGNAELSKHQWRDLHVNAWKRALGLRESVISYLCHLYFA